MRIILVRHFKTVNNEARLIMGWGDAPPAEDWESDLAQVDQILTDKRIQIDGIHSSALGRARDTALYYARKRGCETVRSSPALNEVNYGSFFELAKSRVEEICPQYKTDPDYAFPEGESFRRMQRRSVAYILSLQAAHQHETLLVVAHAGVIRGLISHFLGLDLAANLKRKISHRYIGELRIENNVCVRYDEVGRPSGFVKDGVIEVPCQSSPRLDESRSDDHPSDLSGGEMQLQAESAHAPGAAG